MGSIFSKLLIRYTRKAVNESHNIKNNIAASTLRRKVHLRCDHETQIYTAAESDLKKQLSLCNKDPDHSTFIPVENFTLDHLPPSHRDIDLYELIKTVAGQTVRIDVKVTSQDRPAFWPETTFSYPFISMKGKDYRRTGSGRMTGRVYVYTGGYRDDGWEHWKNCRVCWCKKCEHSVSASRVWYEFDVSTARHVVYDDFEADNTKLIFFYDREDSQVVFIDQMYVVDVNTNRDWCRLKCVTCDKNLADRLTALWQSYVNVWSKVSERYKESRDISRLNFIVSHPHGFLKQVSIGQWLSKIRVGRYDTQFTYTTSTCPGTSGATVYCIGYNWWLFQIVHSGSLNSGVNCSGAGEVW